MYLPVSAPRCTIQKSIVNGLFTPFGTTLYHTKINCQRLIYPFRHHVVPYNNQSATVYLPVSAPRFTIQQSIGNSLFTGFGTTVYLTKINRQRLIYPFRHHVVPYNNQSAKVYLSVSEPRFNLQRCIGKSVFTGFLTTFYLNKNQSTTAYLPVSAPRFTVQQEHVRHD